MSKKINDLDIFNAANDIDEELINETAEKRYDENRDTLSAKKAFRIRKPVILAAAVLAFIAVIIAVTMAASRKNDHIPSASTETDINSGEDDGSGVIRCPVLGDNDGDYSEYERSGLLYPIPTEIIDNDQIKNKRLLTINGIEYSADYTQSMRYTDDSSEFLKNRDYDVYNVDEKLHIEVFNNIDFIKFIYISVNELENQPKIVNDFSEAGLKKTADLILDEIYGSTITERLDSYYIFEYARLFKYANEEQNRYVVSYRAYINNIPTDDVLYVQFSTEGKLWCISVQKYLQYLNINEEDLIPIQRLENEINKYFDKYDYSDTALRDTVLPHYYTMNSSGSLYYVSEWETKHQEENEDSYIPSVEILAIKAIKQK